MPHIGRRSRNTSGGEAATHRAPKPRRWADRDFVQSLPDCFRYVPLKILTGITEWRSSYDVSENLRLSSPASHRRSRISKPATIASTASTVFTVGETLILSSGKSPVRINQIASRIIPRFLFARVLVIANLFPPLRRSKISTCKFRFWIDYSKN